MDNAVRDRMRQGVTVFGAIFQVLIGFVVPVGSLVNRDVSLVIPAGWTFAIWGPIFLLCAVYAVYQALPSKRYDPLLRRIGWPLGLAFVGNGIWTAVQPLQNPVLSQIIITLILIFALVALVRFAKSGGIGVVQRWIVGLPAGLLAGWITAANAVGFNDMLVRLDVLGAGFGAAMFGAGLILTAALVSAVVLSVIVGGPIAAVVTYPLAVLWGLFGLISNQYDASFVTSGVAVLCFGVLVVLLVRAVMKTLRIRRDSGGARVA